LLKTPCFYSGSACLVVVEQNPKGWNEFLKDLVGGQENVARFKNKLPG